MMKSGGVDFTLSEELVDSLQIMATRNNMKVTDVLKRVVVMQHYLETQLLQGKKILLQDAETNTVRELILRKQP